MGIGLGKDFFFEKKKQKTFGYWAEPFLRRTPMFKKACPGRVAVASASAKSERVTRN
jgi:hypothetical protein